jgi:hypothetical protein
MFALLLLSAWGVLHGQEQEQWYLISETELRSIEEYRETSIAEKQSLLSQARQLREDSGSLNRQLTAAREDQRRLEQSFERYDQGQLTLLSSKNGEIAGLNEQLADQKLETANYKSLATLRLFMAIGPGAAWVVYAAYRVWKKFRPGPG